MIKIIQLCSNIEQMREIKSFKSLSELNYRYLRYINPSFNEEPPLDIIIDNKKEWYVGITKPDPNKFGLTSRHYGAWLGHMSCILSSFVDNDYTLVTECDCLLSTNVETFKERVDEAISTLKKHSNYKIVRFESPNNQVSIYKKISDNISECDIMTLGHCYLIHKKDQNWWLNKINETGWHTPDWWINFVFTRSNEKMLCFPDDVLTKQCEGVSEIDNTYRPERSIS